MRNGGHCVRKAREFSLDTKEKVRKVHTNTHTHTEDTNKAYTANQRNRTGRKRVIRGESTGMRDQVTNSSNLEGAALTN